MKRLCSVLALLLLIVAVLPAAADKNKAANALWKKGHDAEARQDYETAFDYYHQA